MQHSIMLAAASLGDTMRETAEQFGLNWPHFIAQCISFAIVAFLLQRFAYKPILKVLADRRKLIAESLENTERIKAELARAEATRHEIVQKANADAGKLIDEAKAAAARLLESESQKAIATANQIVTKAREANDAELVRMKTELRREVGRLVVATTSKVTGKVLTPEDQRRLAEETNRQLVA